MKKFFVPTLVFAIATLLALYNIGHFPKMVGDEGIYVAQAWWLAHFRTLGPYTYWYDHFPLGWAQIGLWQLLVGPISFLGSSVLSARVFMGIILGASATTLYLLTYRLTKSILSSILASIIFITSALTLTFGRMVLLDNIAIFWFLLSLLLLFTHSHKLKNLVLSALTLSIAILSKESLLFFLPPYLFATYYLNRSNPHQKYALLSSFTTVFFALSFFPAIALLKGELFPVSNQVSFLGTILYQSGRGSGIAFWQSTSHFRQMLSVWLTIDPIFIFLGTIATLIIPFLPLPSIQKFISLFTIFFLFFLIRGGQIYDFYIIPILPLLALNVSLLMDYFLSIIKTKIPTLILLFSLILYFLTSSLYPLTTPATNTQLQATSYLKQLPADSLIIANNYSYLDLVLQNKNIIHWYQKVETDPIIQKSLGPVSDILIDEQFARELESNQLPFIKKLLSNESIVTKFGRSIAPGEIVKPYTSEYLTLYAKNPESKTSNYLVTVKELDQKTLDSLKATPPYGILVEKNNFKNSTDLGNLISLLKANLASQTQFIVMQDDTGTNTIPWLNTPNRMFYKSVGEAELATSKKTQTLKDLGFTGAIITSTSDADKYLSSIIDAARSNIIPILRFDGSIPATQSQVVVTNASDLTTLKNANYQGEILQIIDVQQYLEKTN